MKITKFLAATAFAGVFALPVAAAAQTIDQTGAAINADQTNESKIADVATTQSPDGAATQASDPNSIVITGSRIRSPNLESNLPVTTLSGEEFFQRGQNNVGDTLNDLPQLRSTFAQQNPGLGIGIAGLNLLDLRGLGTQRTLVLVNGRRHVASDLLNNAVSVDVNTIPNDLIERVDIVTGGNSAVYGSDAIAGVVNFVLRTDYEGVQLRGGAAISEYGAGGNQFVSGLVGKNFADGRGNITLHGEFARQDRVFGSDIPFLRRQDGFVTTDTDPAGSVNGSDGIPDRTFVRDIRSASINRYSLVFLGQPTANPACGVGIVNGGNPGTPYNCTYVFNEAGQLAAQTGTRTSTGRIGTFIGGNGQNSREDQQLSVLPFLERANFNLLAHYDFSDAASFFFEGKYVRIVTEGSNSGPAFTQGGTFGDVRERPRLDNPFLSFEARTTIANAILNSGVATTTLTAAPTALTAAQRTAIANGTYRFSIARNLTDLGNRDERARRETYRFVAGVRGTFNEDWNYEISANYGRLNENTTVLGNVVSQRLLLALDSGRNPVTGQIQCRAQFDPAARNAYDTSNPGDVAALASDIAACVPYNPFGRGDNAAARNYIVQDTISRGKLEQIDVTAFVSGDSSQLFELPGGPVRFALGAEYRREDAYFQADPLVNSGRTFLNSLQTFDPSAFEVKEAFGEIQVPLLKDLPLIRSLTVTGAARVSDYKGGTGTVWAYNGGVEWSPVRDLRFRANYGRSVRAPNYTETASPLGQNFAPGYSDPCLPQNLGTGTQFRAANCRADLGAIINDPEFITLPTYSLEILSGSNANLSEEKSDSYTIGAVFEPTFIPGLALTVDYYNIKVKNVIVSPSAQQIVNSCYDLPTLQNQFCDLVQRYRGGTGTRGPNDEVPGEVLVGTLTQVPLNFASRRREGIDTQFSYRTNIGADSKLFTRLIYTHQLKNSNYQDPTNPSFENRLLDELGDPKDEFQFNTDVTKGIFTLGYRLRYISPMYVNLYETVNSLQGRPPQDLDYSDIQKYPSVVYHDVRFDILQGTEASGLNFYFGVDNLADKEPPLGSSATGAGSAIYNIRGRTYYAGVRARF